MEVLVIIDVLKKCVIRDCELSLSSQLPRELYINVDEILTRLGGKWNNKKSAHIFKTNPSTLISDIIRTKKLPLKNPTAFFPTPDNMIHTMFNFADFTQGDEIFTTEHEFRILEPSAGQGAIALKLREIFTHSQIDTVEYLEENQEVLKELGFNPHCGDFLEFNKDLSIKYDYIFTNPPFSYEKHPRAYIEHILHSFSMLSDNGVLIAIAPTSFINCKTEMEKNFYDLVSSNLSMEIVKEGFIESGTKVETVIFKLSKVAHAKYNQYRNFVSFGFILSITNDGDCADKFNSICENMANSKNGFDQNKMTTFLIKILNVYKNQKSIFFPFSFMDDYILDIKRIYAMDYETFIDTDIIKYDSYAANVVINNNTNLLDFAV